MLSHNITNIKFPRIKKSWYEYAISWYSLLVFSSILNSEQFSYDLKITLSLAWYGKTILALRCNR